MEERAVSEQRGSGQASITAYPDGPYLLRGAFVLRDELGNEIASPRRIIALCRCGSSRLRPFCDGTHRAIGFRTPSSDPRPDLAPAEEECLGELDAERGRR
jgi:CDGSH-type Zn-finger protein